MNMVIPNPFSLDQSALQISGPLSSDPFGVVYSHEEQQDGPNLSEYKKEQNRTSAKSWRFLQKACISFSIDWLFEQLNARSGLLSRLEETRAKFLNRSCALLRLNIASISP